MMMSHVRTLWTWALWLLTAAAVPSLSAALAPARILVKPKAGVRRAELEQIYAREGAACIANIQRSAVCR